MPGRTLAIGDIHGCHRALVTLLGALAVSSNDTVVFIGDAVDRGPSSRQVVDVESNQVFQSSESGDSREFHLSKYS